ncbi:peroxisomal sarcosine oxidase-like isoform X2 [Eriocheir sinensis]|uniref:peroxisomal sarcosine oxidase-like isoform X2 n=1 Tax=Eriocheir sinensis TaxID=95602 RepID=UPI0021C634F6|nr:peroxisomal sarcosine oxidase-like isoform X2 [Eriocheir sinensis]
MEMLRAATVVVGGGVHGSSAAYHLAKAGQDTILLEQFPLPHSRGSSHGQTRIIRLANYGVPQLTALMADSFGMWRKIEQEAGVSLVRSSPMLVVTDDAKMMARVERSVREGGDTPQRPRLSEVNRKYGSNLPAGNLTLIDPSAGVLMADKCVATLQRLFREAGGRVVDEWPVERVEVGPGGAVEVRGPRGRVRAERIVLCPGPWAGPLLAKMGVHLPLEVRRISVFYWRIKDQATPTVSFVHYGNEYHNYGLAQLEYPGLMKLVQHTGPVISSPEQRDQRGASREQRTKMQQYVREHWPTLHPEPVIEESCLYTMTPDEEFVIDSHPSHPNVVFACGFSGTGFKTAPAVGDNLCRLVLGRAPRHDLSAFRASRFAPRSRM